MSSIDGPAVTGRWPRCAVLASLIVAGWMSLVGLAVAEEPTMVAGIAAADITPSYPVRLNGFLVRKSESTGVRQRIWAKAIALGTDEERPVILITTDSLGVSDEIVQEVARRLKQKAGIDPARVSITATHTHSAPMLNGVAPNIFGEPIPDDAQSRIDRYTAEFKNHLEGVALAALKDRQPARLSWGIGKASFAINRRARGGAGPVDHDVPMLAVHDPAGKLRGIYVNYACHCVTLSDPLISGDWAGYAMEHIERLHPGAFALISVGCGADSNPSSGVTGSNADVASQQGVEIATAVDRLLAGPLRPIAGVPEVKTTRIDLDLAPVPTREEFVQTGKRMAPTGYFARVQVAKLDRGETLRTKISYPITTWAFGDDLAMVFLPGEVVAEYALRLKSELDGRRLWTNAYANAAPCYIPSERVLQQGGYEGGGAMIYYDQPNKFAPGLEDKIIGTVRSHLDAAFAPPVDPAKTQGSRAPAPEEALFALKTLPGLTVDLVAAEPLVTSPVAIDFGPDGRLWVCEMYDYPQGLDGNYQPGGRVRMLEDRDGDGRFDSSSVFLEGIPFPTGVTVWRKGVLVCAAPDILYAEDTNGDGKADEVRKLFSGFGTENFQARVNSLEYGLDGWVYGSCGLFGGEITNSFGKPPVRLGNRDFRMKPDTGELEPATGRTQQGRPRDDWGNWFGCDNSNFARHYPLADHDLRRNPHVAPPAAFVSLPADAEANRVHSATDKVQLFKLSGQGGRATAACGIGVYRDDLLGDAFRGDVFTCEPVSLVVHHLHLSPRGASFAGERPATEQGREFLASTNNWFRPVQARTGPDGGLWVVDMARFVIEHPRWIPEADLAKLDVRAGYDLGRLFRVRPADQPARSWPRLDRLDTAGLVAALDSPSGWQRDMAMQLLLWKPDPAAAAPLATLLREGKRPETRMQALCTLDCLGSLAASDLVRACSDEHAGVRRQAVRIAGLRSGTDPALVGALTERVEDSDPQVQLELAVALGQSPSPAAAETLAKLATRSGATAHLQGAIASSLSAGNVVAVLKAALRDPAVSPPESLLRAVVTTGIAALPEDQVAAIVGEVFPGNMEKERAWQRPLAAVALESLDRRHLAFSKLPESAQASITSVIDRVLGTVKDLQRPEAERVAAIGVLGRIRDRQEADLQLLAELLQPQHAPKVQAAAVAALARIDSPLVPQRLTERWSTLSPALRNQILDLLIGRAAWQSHLLAEIEQGRIAAAALDLPRRQLLLTGGNAEIATRAEKVLAGAVNADRQKVLDTYQPALALSGDATRGQAVFVKTCSVCHRLDSQGHAIGPDLATLSAKTPAFFLQEILDPNRNVDSRYVTYLAVTTEGQTHTGLLVAESASGITLQAQEDKRVTLLRADLDELASSGKSLMPEGFEKELDPQKVADLLAYLARSKPVRKTFPGNDPGVVQPAPNGTVSLPATKGEIYGEQIVFEAPFQNIGYWHGANDSVTWQVQLPQPADLDVWLDAACHPGAEGNRFAVLAGTTRVEGAMPSTGGWDRYRPVKAGTVSLAAGAQTVTVRPAGDAIRGALMDLRAVYLVPPGMNPPSMAEATPNAIPQSPVQLAEAILSDQTPKADRDRFVEASLPHADEVVAVMARGLGGDSTEEYRRIPWIWRVSIGAARQKDPQVLTRLLDASLPKMGEPLRDWQAVVLGGGIINGLSLEGRWPTEEIVGWLKDRDELRIRWNQAIALSFRMAEDTAVRNGTRYDALRMVACGDWELARPLLAKYLGKGMNAELQMGAVSGLADCDSPAVPALLIEAFPGLTPKNRSLAIGALLRSDSRKAALVEALEKGTLKAEEIPAADRRAILSGLSGEQRSKVEALWAPSSAK